jgi:hypothetical protein
MEPQRRSTHIALTTCSALGLLALFLPFSWSTSPYHALVDWGLWRLVLPACFPLVTLPVSIRWITAGSLSRVERSIGYMLGALAVGMIGLSYAQLDSVPTEAVEWIALIAPLLILLFGGGALARNLRAGRPKAYSPIMAMQVAYIANAILALASAFPDWEVGAYAILATVMAYAIQIGLVRKTPEALAAT